MKPGDKVRLKANPSRMGTLTNEYDGSPRRPKVLVRFFDGSEEFMLEGSLEKVEEDVLRPYSLIEKGRFGKVNDLRGAITYYRLSGRLANLIYSLNTTNTQFFSYQYKPVMQLLDSPCRGLLIADEVGLGKTIEAGLIWTELRARIDAKRLLVLCPAMLREKWQDELRERFGIQADICDAKELVRRIEVGEHDREGFAVIASLQGLRPPKKWKEPANKTGAARLARLLDNKAFEDPVFDMIVVDEAHYMRNPETQTNKLGRLLRPVCENLLLLSATPIQLRSDDLFHLLNLLDSDAFPYMHSFADTLKANAPIVQLRDRLLRKAISQQEYLETLQESIDLRLFKDNLQLQYMLANPPENKELASYQGRSRIADRLDRINPLAKVITRTRKRDVQEMRVVRLPKAIRATMTPVEESFYREVTESVQAFCETLGIATGFMLTIPQRQMASCMAAACRAWQEKIESNIDEQVEESLHGAFGTAEEGQVKKDRKELGALLQNLLGIAEEIGDFEKLKRNDSKYEVLRTGLLEYWKGNPGKKVVLFSFYRETLRYLRERLAEDGVESIIVQGGMDKHEAIKHFSEPEGPDILLSTEVAAEGVDLQFSSLLLNYDLPWNPMRIEQRIGRIDRIGQKAEKILIWNFFYGNSIDERIYDRLLNRLNIFQEALGSIESILGDKIRELGYELLVHKLSPEEEKSRIDQTAVAIETLNRDTERLEKDATQLIAHGDYIQNQVNAAREIGRYVSGADLYSYVRDYFTNEYEGTRFLQISDDELIFDVEFSIDAKLQLKGFLEANQLSGKTRILGTRKTRLVFENQVVSRRYDVEVISQYHPLVRFVSERLKSKGRAGGYFPVTAAEVSSLKLPDMLQGTYVYAVSRWAVSGARDIERLEYAVKNFDTGEWLEAKDAETLVNSVAMEGKDWHGVESTVSSVEVACAFDECEERLEEGFKVFEGDIQRENSDRIHLMINMLERHKDNQVLKLQGRIRLAKESGDAGKIRLIPANEGKIRILNERIEERIAGLERKQVVGSSQSFVSGGVVCVR